MKGTLSMRDVTAPGDAHNLVQPSSLPAPASTVRAEAVRAFNAATDYRLDPAVHYSPDVVETMCFVALMRGQLHVVRRLRTAFAQPEGATT